MRLDRPDDPPAENGGLVIESSLLTVKCTGLEVWADVWNVCRDPLHVKVFVPGLLSVILH